MRRMIITGLALLTATGSVNAQTFNEWFKQRKTQIKYLVEQIGALKAYGEIVNKGYAIADKGLTGIVNSKDEDYRQHDGYFLSLWKVKTGIRNYPKVSAIYTMKAAIENQRHSIKSGVTGFLNGKERLYIASVYANLSKGCNDLANELEMVLKDDQLQVTDDERIARIDRIYYEMQDRYTFAKTFSNQIKILAFNCLKQKGETGKLSSLYGLK